MSKVLSATEVMSEPNNETMQFTITQEDIDEMACREYEELMSKDKEELVKMLMGTERYYNAMCKVRTKHFLNLLQTEK